MDVKIIANVEIDKQTITIYTLLPPPSAGLTKQEILERFVTELRPHAASMLGRVVRLNGRMTTEMALAAGIVAARFGATGVELYDPSRDEYVPVAGLPNEVFAPLAMPMLVLPGMEVEIVADGGLFRRGARAVVLNVGRNSVNIAENRGSWRGRRRDTGWTAIENVRPVAWEEEPEM